MLGSGLTVFSEDRITALLDYRRPFGPLCVHRLSGWGKSLSAILPAAQVGVELGIVSIVKSG